MNNLRFLKRVILAIKYTTLVDQYEMLKKEVDLLTSKKEGINVAIGRLTKERFVAYQKNKELSWRRKLEIYYEVTCKINETRSIT